MQEQQPADGASNVPFSDMTMDMTLEEMQARAILLAQAFETSALLTDSELDRVDDEASLLVLTASHDAKGMA